MWMLLGERHADPSMSGTSTADERRRATRVPFGRPVRLQFGSVRDVIEAATTDISVGGMFIRTTSFRRPGAKLDFRIALTGTKGLIEGSAEVVRVHGGDESELPSGMGIHFLELRGDSETLVRGVVDARRSG